MIKIITDTTSGLPRHIAEAYDIPVLPQIVIFGEEAFRDDTELDTQEFLRRLRSSPTLPKTAAPPPALFHPVFERLLAQGYRTLICLHPSSELSGTVRSATTAAQDFPDADIRVVDTRTIAAPLATVVILAERWAREGVDADTIIARVREMLARQRVYFVVDTLEYLHRGGRIGGAQALLGGLLQIKPILTLRDGRVEPFEKQRTQKRALERLRELVLGECPRRSEAYLAVMHADAEAQARALAEDFAAHLGIPEVPIYELPPAIVTHAGPGVLAVSFFVPA
ncbi:MAG: DegV family protein [Anaerolineae bacterium]|nr:DegV family protein [Anaerolineae bacterium]MCX8066305.1 DegV family protein [Anaerolineae bacterium]MDW7991100.1 DegV family protein [Anaerolineae bacterium]